MQSQYTVVAGILRRSMPVVLALSVVAAVLIPASPAAAELIFLDPGHGGRYPGAVYAGVEEQWVNLLITLEARTELLKRGHRVKLSRDGDYTIETGDRPTWHWDDAKQMYYLYADAQTGVYSYTPDGSPIPYDDLQARCDAANAWGADLFVSIHNNAGGTTATGTETFYNSWDTPTDRVLSMRLATYVQAGVVASAGTYDRRVDDIGFYVIRWANMPAALVEVAFLSNPVDRAKLLSAAFRRNAAIGIADGIERYLATDPIQPREPRIAGGNRYETAAKAALTGWPDGAQTVIVASGEQWPDSLAAAPLSKRLDAPVLLSAADGLPSATAHAIAALEPSSIVVLGGERALSSAVTTQVAEVASLETTMVVRLAGQDRYETAALIAREVGESARVVVVSGEAYPDAISASAYAARVGAPILLTRRSTLTTAAAEVLVASSPTQAVVVGGPSVISEQVVDALRSNMSVQWLYGPDRYATNIRVIRQFWPTGDIRPYVATATDFPDALVAGSLAGRTGQPIVLCGARVLPGVTREWVMHETSRIRSFTMMGGPNAVSYLLEWQLAKAR
ncbi:MAG: cell wall-binding repeat-containing protein, partial [Coriobacteriia bacterium]|nr:cell wall-binding repeat-containing protein [Coriobacteriia bacterium]